VAQRHTAEGRLRLSTDGERSCLAFLDWTSRAPRSAGAGSKATARRWPSRLRSVRARTTSPTAARKRRPRWDSC
jgi:hypothetical protein